MSPEIEGRCEPIPRTAVRPGSAASHCRRMVSRFSGVGRPLARLVLMVALSLSTGMAWAGDPDRQLEGKLLERGVKSDLESLVEALGSDSIEIRRMAAQYLSMRPDSRARENLVRAAGEDPDALVRAQAINALLALDCESAGSLAVAALEDSRDEVAEAVLASGMARCGQPEGLGFYLSMMERGDDKLARYRAVSGCGAYVLTGSGETLTSAVDCLVRATSDPESSVRSAARKSVVVATGSYGIEDSELLEALEKIPSTATSDEERKAAADVLRALQERRQAPNSGGPP